MTQTLEVAADQVPERPRLIFFHSKSSGRCRRVEGFIAQVLQRRRNHDTFRIHHVDVDEREDLAQRFGVDSVPSILVVDGRRIAARLESPGGCREIEELLAPWVR